MGAIGLSAPYAECSTDGACGASRPPPLAGGLRPKTLHRRLVGPMLSAYAFPIRCPVLWLEVPTRALCAVRYCRSACL
eukprot:1383985-Rhodomonas_salina.1